MNENMQLLTSEIISALEKMDTEMLDRLLTDNSTYQKMSKKVFLEKLKALFLKLKEKGNSFLTIRNGFCLGCYPGCEGKMFIGNKSKDYFSIVFETTGNKLNDLCECTMFINSEGGRKWRKKRLWIDKPIEPIDVSLKIIK